MCPIATGEVVEGYEFMERIGEGGFSSVYKVRSIQYDRLFVAKVARIRGQNVERAWKAFDSEIRALMRLNHPCIIKLYAHFRHGEDNFVMVLQYCPQGSIADIMKNGPVNGAQLIHIVRDVCSALIYAWSRGVQHRDIKPANILLDEHGRANLADFGISNINVNDGVDHIEDFRCSPACAPPEILMKRRHDPIKSDMWSLGVTILWMAHGQIPWAGKTRDEIKLLIRHGQYIMPRDLNPTLARMVKGMLAVDPEERVFPTTEDLAGLIAKARIISPQESKPELRSFASLRSVGGHNVRGRAQVLLRSSGTMVMGRGQMVSTLVAGTKVPATPAQSDDSMERGRGKQKGAPGPVPTLADLWSKPRGKPPTKPNMASVRARTARQFAEDEDE